MTTKRQIARAFKDLLACNDDLILQDNALHLVPIRHSRRSVFISSTSSAGWCHVDWAFCPFVVPVHQGFYATSRGSIILETPKIGPRFPNDIGYPVYVRALTEHLEEKILPMLRSFDDLNVWRYSQHWGSRFIQGSMVSIMIDVARGDFDNANAGLDLIELVRPPVSLVPGVFHSPDHIHTLVQADLNRHDLIKNVIAPLVRARDRKRLAEILHLWEERAVTTMKLTQWWERTPFPLELE